MLNKIFSPVIGAVTAAAALLRVTHGIFVIWFETDAIFKSIPNQMIDCGIGIVDADRTFKSNREKKAGRGNRNSRR